MGLSVSHGCWSGSYSTFMRWRTAVAKAAGINLKSMDGFGGETRWESLKPDVLHELLNHSDCDGTLRHQICRPLADRLTELLLLIESDPRDFDWQIRTKEFIAGLRTAAEMREDVEFF